MIATIFTLRCPKCGKGKISAGLFKTARSCSSCGMLFEKESGYFTGAIYPLYGLCGALGVSTAFVATFGFDLSIWQGTGLGAAAVLAASPYLYHLSRSAYLNTEERFFKRMGN